jgi:two-component system cell cycle sensor histidine kinase/response regulator CckA
MTKSRAADAAGGDDASLRRIAELEAEVNRLRQLQGIGNSPLPAREALLTEVERIAHLGSWILDLETREVKWSEELFRILGYDPAKDKASPEIFFQVLHPEDAAVSRKNFEQIVAKGEMIQADFRLIRKDGALRDIRTNGAGLRNKDGKIDRVVGTVLDVTESRKAERERKQLEDQLRQAQKMEVVGRVAGGVAHDFNNLLTIISGNADLLIEESKDERLRRIRDAAEVGAALTRQLLAFSRQSVVQPQAVDMNAAVRDIVRILGRLLGEDIQIRLDLSEEPASILADRGQVQQILLNLAVNARDAMATGGELVFSTRVTPERWVELSVRDTGKGMDAATRERAFEPFFTTKELGKGTGLGLSTVHDIVSQTSGTIAIDSQPGSGTQVTVRFPLRAEVPAAPAAAVPVPLRRAGENLQHESILLVEDNPDLRELVGAFLSTAGYRVQTVGRPGEAETLWKTEGDKIDILIADMVMPEKSGLELAKSLLARKPSLKTLFISGYSPNRSGLGSYAFLQKPFTRNELLQTVRTLCEGPGANTAIGTNGWDPKPSDSGEGPHKDSPRPKLVPFPHSP